jgi:hypothetical protein
MNIFRLLGYEKAIKYPQPKIDVPKGIISWQSDIGKFGEAPAVQTTTTVIWDGANSTDTLYNWVPPTEARIHDIVSTSLNDAAGLSGARVIRIWGLPDWASKEISEDIILTGTTPVPTVNSYVIIHRMKCLYPFGSGNSNAGDIKATAQTDGTVTAMILTGKGQTGMAILGIPSVQTAFLSKAKSSIIRPAAASRVSFDLLVNEDPTQNTNAFLNKHDWGLDTTGTSSNGPDWDPYKKIPGPAIIKIDGVASANNIRTSAWFNGYLVDN